VTVTRSQFVIAVPSLERSAAYYRDVLGFTVQELATGWLRFELGACSIMAGECRDALPPRELGDHSWFAYLVVDDLEALHARATAAGAEITKPLRREPWGMREFGVRTADGHRIMFASAAAARENLAGASPFEPVIGFSRAVRIGNAVHVSGTGPVGADTADAAAQTRHVLGIIGDVLARAGASLADVVRTRMFVTDISRWEEYARAHGEAFRDVMPATSMVEVSALIDPAMLVEIEVVAYRPGVGDETTQ